MGTEELLERLSAIAEELDDMAFERLREASSSSSTDGGPDPELVASEKRLTRARRSVEKAIATLKTDDTQA
ncbi:MAG: hypothetical protein ACRDV4_07325 [Acidimicrobiales bacterium]